MGGVDLPGQLLVRAGLISAEELAELENAQHEPMQLASLAYAFGLTDEESLARVVSRERGIPAAVLDKSIIALELFDGVAAELALLHRVLPVAEDRRHLFVCAEDPAAVAEVLREIEFIRGKTVVPHVALSLPLRRAMSAGLRARAHGQSFLIGAGAEVAGDLPPGGSIFVVSEPQAPAPGTDAARAVQVLLEEVTKEMMLAEILVFEEVTSGTGSTDAILAAGTAPPTAIDDTGMPVSVPQDPTVAGSALVSARTWVRALSGGDPALIDLDRADGPSYHVFHDRPPFLLVVDDDLASSNFLVKELGPLGCRVDVASSAELAIGRITSEPPDAIIADLMLPQVDGIQLCRAIKRSTKYARIAVILTSAMADSQRLTEDVMTQCGADEYLEKPIDLELLKTRLKALFIERGIGQARSGAQSFDRALARYRSGDIDGAVEELRRGIEVDPSSAKHHFVLANLLHKKSLIYEAIDEYEATVELKPDYFPALTRLAYLYYRSGFAAKAIETWRRSLPLCTDSSLRHNIEVFMRKLIADLDQKQEREG
jgi:DNA-binding response OmpR family regulator